MTRVVFDIETLGFPMESFSRAQQEYLLKFADTNEKREEAVQKLSLHPLTAQVVAVAMLNPDTNSGKVFYQGEPNEHFESGDGKIEYRSGNEQDIILWFWEHVKRFDQFITFNGRGFDCPFLMLRSAIVVVKPTRNLVPNRYDSSVHCDLLDQLTFYGAVRKFSLDFYCRAFSIKSPKGDGISGVDVGALFKDKRFKEIAMYCLGDVQATAELYRRWDDYLNIKD